MKRFISVIFFVVFIFFAYLSSRALAVYAPPPTISQQQTALEDISSQIVVSFRKTLSPKEIRDTLSARDKSTSTLAGKIEYFFLELAGKTPGRTYYTSQLEQIASTEQKAGITASAYGYKFQNGNTAYYMQVKKAADIDSALRLMQSLPQVDFASRRVIIRANGTQQIQSTEKQGNLTQQIVVQFKPGFTPDQIAQTVNQIAKTQSLPLGFLRISSETQSKQTEYKNILKTYSQVQTKAKIQDQNIYLNFQIKKPTPLQNALVISIQPGQSVEQAISAYKSLPQVEYAQKRPIIHALATPNDPFFPKQWGMQKIQAPAAWDIATGNSNTEVAVVDTGVDYNHPDLNGEVDIRNGSNMCANSNVCTSANTSPNDPMDDQGHGTHVAGIIGAIGNNNVGVAGVNWNVKIMAVKILGSDGTGDMGPGLEFAIQNGAKVINLSAGGCYPYPADSPEHCPELDAETQIDPVTKQVMDDVVNSGALLVLAAGNGNEDAKYDNPANYSLVNPGKILIVGASTPSDARANFSNYGSIVSIAAPGEGILSTTTPNNNFPQQMGCTGQSYCALSGTSMATPHVAGAAGLLLSINPNLTAQQLISTLTSTADQISTDQPIGPRLNLFKAVQAVTGGAGNNGGPTATPTPTSVPGTPTATPTPTSIPNAPTATPTPRPGVFTVSINLPGIGPGENTNPIHNKKIAELEFLNPNGVTIGKVPVNLTFQNNSFVGDAPLDGIPPGNYQMKVNFIDGTPTLTKFIPGIYTVTPGYEKVVLPTVTLVSGDINLDNVVDITDYNLMIYCLRFGGCNNSTADLNDDGVVDLKDLNIFLRQLNNRVGD